MIDLEKINALFDYALAVQEQEPPSEKIRQIENALKPKFFERVPTFTRAITGHYSRRKKKLHLTIISFKSSNFFCLLLLPAVRDHHTR